VVREPVAKVVLHVLAPAMLQAHGDGRSCNSKSQNRLTGSGYVATPVTSQPL
jgi:hypothetical protein